MRQAHRVAWELTNGEVENGLYVCHHCDNIMCVNPNHLFLGTQQDNMDDMVAKGRSMKLAGEKNPHAKLTVAEVLSIRKRFEEDPNVSTSVVGKEFKISQVHACSIKNRNVWAWL